MICKYLPCPERLRQIPTQFSWVDHKLVRDAYIDDCHHQALALYLFLVTVADHQGISYYADKTIMKRLRLNETALKQARTVLCRQQLIAYQAPHYQILALPETKTHSPQITEHITPSNQTSRHQSGLVPVQDLLKQLRDAING